MPGGCGLLSVNARQTLRSELLEQRPSSNPSAAESAREQTGSEQPYPDAGNGADQTQEASETEPIIDLPSHQTNSQAKEVAVMVVIGALRLVMTNLAAALTIRTGSEEHQIKNWIIGMSQDLWHKFTISYLTLVFFLVIMLMNGRRIPRRFLDVLGIAITITMLVQFIKINLLLLTPSGPRSIVLAQAIVFIIYFGLTWGWIFWRLDAVKKQKIQTVIALDEAEKPITMFDYYHASFI